MQHFFRKGRRSPCRERGLKSRLLMNNIRYKMSLPVQGAWIEIINWEILGKRTWSLPVQGAWIEMRIYPRKRLKTACRSPCRERGLKLLLLQSALPPRMSLPVQGAWIEIRLPIRVDLSLWSLPVQGAWIEMADQFLERRSFLGRSPCRERGLKS